MDELTRAFLTNFDYERADNATLANTMTLLGFTGGHLEALERLRATDQRFTNPNITSSFRTGHRADLSPGMENFQAAISVQNLISVAKDWTTAYPSIPVGDVLLWEASLGYGDETGTTDTRFFLDTGTWVTLTPVGWLAHAVGLTPTEFQEQRPATPTLWMLLGMQHTRTAARVTAVLQTLTDPIQMALPAPSLISR